MSAKSAGLHEMIYEVFPLPASKGFQRIHMEGRRGHGELVQLGGCYPKTHLLSHNVISHEGNVTVCDEDEVAGGFKVQHRDRYTLYPKEKLVEEIIQDRWV